jgi:DNA-binding transcriptional ArsR family regulator
MRARYPGRQISTKWLTIARIAFTLNHMVENPAALDEVFHALASEPRRRMLGALAEGERTVGDLAAPFEMSLAAVSKHIKVLEGAGLVERRPAGRTTICRLTPGPLAEAHEWVAFYERFWNRRLDALEALFAEKKKEAP